MKDSKAVPVGMRMPTELADWLKRQAEANRRSISGQAVWVLEQYRTQQQSVGAQR